MTLGRVLRLALAAGIASLLTACGTAAPSRSPSPTSSPHAGTSSIARPVLPSSDEAARALTALPTTARVSPAAAGYSRSSFGRSWIDVDGNGCNQRDDVLLRDGVPGTLYVARQGRCDHDVIAGAWVDPYTGRTLRFDDLKIPAQARAIQIDHVVPLAEAWVSGASVWPDARRRAFANDLAELLAVDGPANASKGDGDPAAWRPKKAYQCDYARRWISVKAAWVLAIDKSERRALRQMLSFCP